MVYPIPHFPLGTWRCLVFSALPTSWSKETQHLRLCYTAGCRDIMAWPYGIDAKACRSPHVNSTSTHRCL